MGGGSGGILECFVPHVRVGSDVELRTQEDYFGGVAVSCETFGCERNFDGFEERIAECEEELGRFQGDESNGVGARSGGWGCEEG